MEGDGAMIFLAFDLISYVQEELYKASVGDLNFLSNEEKEKLQTIYNTDEAIRREMKNIAIPAQSYLNNQLVKHVNSYATISNSSSFCPWRANSNSMKVAIQYFCTRGWITVETKKDCDEEIPRFISIAKGIIKVVKSRTNT